MIARQVTRHAVHRWRQRVHQHISPATAEAEILDFLEHAKLRVRPPRWLASKVTSGHLRYARWHERPGICLVVDVRDASVLTVITKAEGRRQRSRLRMIAESFTDPPHWRRRPPWRRSASALAVLLVVPAIAQGTGMEPTLRDARIETSRARAALVERGHLIPGPIAVEWSRGQSACVPANARACAAADPQTGKRAVRYRPSTVRDGFVFTVARHIRIALATCALRRIVYHELLHHGSTLVLLPADPVTGVRVAVWRTWSVAAVRLDHARIDWIARVLAKRDQRAGRCVAGVALRVKRPHPDPARGSYGTWHHAEAAQIAAGRLE